MSKRILIVDDDHAIREGFGQVLRRAGYEVDLADNGDVARTLFEDRDHDLVITDLLMPRSHGLSLIQELRDVSKDVPIIAISGGGTARRGALLETASKFGADLTLQKPVSVSELKAVVNQFLSSD